MSGGTKQQFKQFSITCVEDACLVLGMLISGITVKHYFSEWNDAGIELYLTVNGEGTKISSISALDKSDILAELFEFMFVEQKNPNNSYADFEIVDIE